MLVESALILTLSFIGAYTVGRFVGKRILNLMASPEFDRSSVPEVETYEI